MSANWIYTAFEFGLGTGASLILGMFGACGVAYGLDLVALRRSKRSRSKPDPIQDMTTWKHQRRIDEARQWQRNFDQILNPLVIESHRYTVNDLRMLTDNYGHKDGHRRYRKGWDGLHHATCPYECDCPQTARRAA